MRKLSQHFEWLSLIDITGTFLTVSSLENVFPQGLSSVESRVSHRLRSAYGEWQEAVDLDDSQLLELHREWIKLVLVELLEYEDEVLANNSTLEKPFNFTSQEHGGSFTPDFVILKPADRQPLLFISIQPPGTRLDSIQRGDGWPASSIDRMILLCRSTECSLGIVTNGEQWALIKAATGTSSSIASWYARLWFQEPITLRAFYSLLDVRRFFGPTEETLVALLEESSMHQEDITNTLGEQVRRAVEVLVQCLDKADQDRNRELLHQVSPAELYEAGLTVMMRLVFILCAEERGLLLSGEPVYDQYYAVSTLRSKLEHEKDRYGAEVLQRRYDAWARLLSVIRAVYGGIEHESLRLPALGGSLFDPDRFPFLEGRLKGTKWRVMQAAPLPIDNRTVLLLLDALQILEQPNVAVKLSYQALDVEQIGHVYEGLLEHAVIRVPDVTLGLRGSRNAKNPNLELVELEKSAAAGAKQLLTILKEKTGRSESALRNAMGNPVEAPAMNRVMSVCGGDQELADRIKPYANLLRTDAWDDPIIYKKDSFMITMGSDRRETGTHYTPKALTETIVTTALEPIVYIGPAEGKPREEWILRSPAELLDLKICDPAMGSGAFLVQTCRFLGERLVESWSKEEESGKTVGIDGEVFDRLGSEEPMPRLLDERLTIALRLVAERCIYGVDINPLAVELAKLSIWLITMAKGYPFGFLDHNLRSGDSLLGICKMSQLTNFNLNVEEKHSQPTLFEENIKEAVTKSISSRKKIRVTRIRDIKDVDNMGQLDLIARNNLESVNLIANALISEYLEFKPNTIDSKKAIDKIHELAEAYLNGDSQSGKKLKKTVTKNLTIDISSDSQKVRKPFNWPLEFPEVFQSSNRGFNAMVSNPPFMRGHDISGNYGKAYRNYLATMVPNASAGIADLCAYFILRMASLVSERSTIGFIATNSISEGDSRRISLDNMCDTDFKIIFAQPNFKWPGTAAVIVSLLTIWKGEWHNQAYIGNIPHDYISPSLKSSENPKTFKLSKNGNKVYGGSYILGDGFILSDNEANKFLAEHSNDDVILPYINGVELNSTPSLHSNRWVICFWDWPLEKAQKYRECFNRIEALVKISRKKVARDRYRKLWWLHAENRPGLYHAIGLGRLFLNHPKGWNKKAKPLHRVIIKAKTSDTWAFAFFPTSTIFDQAIIVIASDSDTDFAVLQSSIHEIWARHSGTGSTMKNDLRYSPPIFETFPFPDSEKDLSLYGKQYYEARNKAMNEYEHGFTKIYNRFHNRNASDEKILTLRKLHMDLDKAVVEAYGWENIELDHGFHQTSQGLRFSVSEKARREILQCLLKLNHERHAEEERQGLHSKPKGLTAKVNKEAYVLNDQQNLFGLVAESTQDGDQQ